jgi:hypothetical protein
MSVLTIQQFLRWIIYVNKLSFLYKRQDNFITEAEAEELCRDKISGSLAVQEYTEVNGNEDPEDVIRQCTFDVVVCMLIQYMRLKNQLQSIHYKGYIKIVQHFLLSRI